MIKMRTSTAGIEERAETTKVEGQVNQKKGRAYHMYRRFPAGTYVQP